MAGAPGAVVPSAPGLSAGSRPAFRSGVRLTHDGARGQDALLYPEGVLLLNETAGAVLTYCDGARTVTQIAAELARDYTGAAMTDVLELLTGLVAKRLIVPEPEGRGPSPRPGKPRAAPAQRRDRQHRRRHHRDGEDSR